MHKYPVVQVDEGEGKPAEESATEEAATTYIESTLRGQFRRPVMPEN
jgi:hypothetical protein